MQQPIIVPDCNSLDMVRDQSFTLILLDKSFAFWQSQQCYCAASSALIQIVSSALV